MNISARDNISLGVSNFFVDIKALSLNPHSLEKSEKLFSTAFKPDEEYSILRSPELMTNSYNIECYLESGIAAKECGKDGSVSEENLLDIMAERCEKLKDLMSRVYSGEELENILGKIETGYYNATKKTFDTVFSQIAQPFYQKCVSNEITGEENIFEDMSAKYEKLRTAICEKYSGDDREKFLAALDSSYDNVSERDIAGGINYIVNEQTMRTKLRIVWNKMAKNIKHGIFNELRSSLSAYDNYDSRTYNQNSIKWLESIKNNVINLAKKSREYIALGNHAPSNDLEKISFDNFISNSGDSESEYLSYSDIKSLTSVCVNISNIVK